MIARIHRSLIHILNIEEVAFSNIMNYTNWNNRRWYCTIPTRIPEMLPPPFGRLINSRTCPQRNENTPPWKVGFFDVCREGLWSICVGGSGAAVLEDLEWQCWDLSDYETLERRCLKVWSNCFGDFAGVAAELLSKATGWNCLSAELMRIGARIHTMKKMFNVR